MKKLRYIFPIAICSLFGVSQAGQEIRQLEPGRTFEREIAGGEAHTYQITLTADQFIRVMAEQKGADVTLALSGPDGQQAPETNLTAVGGKESLSRVAIQNGRHQIVARAATPSAPAGAYQIRLEIREAATAQDRQRISAEQSLAEASKLSREAAVEKLQEALAKWRELADQYWEVFTLNSLGGAYRLLGRFDKTIELCEQALEISRRIKAPDGESTALTNIGIAHSIMGRQDQAIVYFEQALAVRREAKMRAGEAASLSNLGVSHNLQNRYDRAIEYLNQALALSRELKDRRSEGRALHNLGESSFYLSRFDSATEYQESAIAIHRELKDLFAEATTLNSLARTQLQVGRPERAVEYLEQSLRIKRELKDRNGEGISLNTLAVTYREMGRFEEAREYLEQSLKIGREVKNPDIEAVALTQLGNVAFDTGRPEQAIDYNEQALRIRRAVKNSNGEAGSLTNLGNANSFLGRYERAIEYYEQARAIYRELKNRAEEGSTLTNMAIVYWYLGLYDRAIGRLEEALAISQSVKNRIGEGQVLNNLGDVYNSQGRYKEAIDRFEQALAILREVKNRAAEGSVLGNIGSAYLSLGRPESAVKYFEQALAINREVADRPIEASSLAGLGRAHLALGRGETAVEYFQQALAINREVKDRAREMTTLHSFAEAERGRGRLDRAQSLIEECLQVTESMRADIYSPEQRASYFASAQGAYEFYIDLLMSMRRAEPGRGHDAMAVRVSERARARGLVDMLAEDRADIRQGVDVALLERERALAWQINARAQQLIRSRGPERTSLSQEINRLEDEYQQAQAAIRRASPRYAALAQPQPLTLPEIQRQLDEGTLLLEYSLGAERSYLWAITQNSLDSYELPRREQIEQAARQVYDLLTTRGRPRRGETPPQRRSRLAAADAQLADAAMRLSDMLLSPVAAKLGDNRLVIVADGALQYIPFAMLPEPERGRSGKRESGREGERESGRQGVQGDPQSAIRNPRVPIRNRQSFIPLIVRHEVISLPSATTIAVQRSELAGRQPAPKTLAVIADPVFAASDQRMKAVAKGLSTQKDETLTDAPAESAENTRIIEHLAEGSTTGAARKLVIPRLPFSRREADQIAAIASGAPNDENLRAVDFKASRAVASGPELGQYRYIHFATHGLLDSERPGLSSLVLSLVDEQGRPQDGFLRAHEIYNLNLPAELVVLSACQTGLGKDIRGEGLVGLTRGFMYAGAARVVVSLWNVNDRATSELMSKFYQKMLKDGQRPAAALRAAQVEMWRRRQWQSPYYWAAFTLQGEWK